MTDADEEAQIHDGMLDRIERDIGVGSQGAEPRQRLLEIAERCPVHRTLTWEISIPHAGLARAGRALMRAEAH